MAKIFFKIILSSEFFILLAVLAALGVANSSFYEQYHSFFHRNFFLENFSSKNISFDLIINDFLMVIFFVLVGLELKREFLVGELSSKEKFLLPIFAAFGGVAFPALIFFALNYQNPQNLSGFAIPCATDIAFTYAIVKAFGSRIPNALKVFVITLAVADDLIAILIIAFFYSKNLQFLYLIASLGAVGVLALLNFKNIEKITPYIFIGFILWYFILKSGIHPTIAGVVLAAFIPYKINNKFLLQNFAHQIAPIVNFFILPLFAFANSGLQIKGLSLNNLFDPVILGITFGLFFGKQFGIFGTSYLLIKAKICKMPKQTNWQEFYAVSILAGIGFTMSLFVGNLAFNQIEILDKAKIAVLVGSLLSAAVGGFCLLMIKKKF